MKRSTDITAVVSARVSVDAYIPHPEEGRVRRPFAQVPLQESQELPLACFLTRLFSARPAGAEKKSFAHSSEVVRSACLTLAAAASNPLLISRVTANFVLSAPRCCWLEPQRDSRGAGWLPETEALGGVTG